MAPPKIDYATLFADIPTPLMMLDPQLCFITANQAYLAMTGRQLQDMVGRHVFDVFPGDGDHRASVQSAFEKALAGKVNRTEKLNFAIAGTDGTLSDRYWTSEHVPVRDREGTIIGVLQHGLDVTSEVAAERMRDTISQEYDHRVRNILTKVSAIARLTARSAVTMDQFLIEFDPRISAMARAHQMLVRGGWERLGLAELVAGELQSYEQRTKGQVSVDGPDVILSSRVAQAFGMAIHELMTNALKHGALSLVQGGLQVQWHVVIATGALHFEWRETGMANVAEPQTQGFGSTIIDRIMPVEIAGTVTRQFAPTGMVCTIDVPEPARD